MASKRKEELKTKVQEFKAKKAKRIAKLKTALGGQPKNNTVTENRLELLITTVDRSKGEYYIDLIQSFDVNMQFVALGQGTADAKLLSRLGFTDNAKTVIFSVIQESKLKDALETLEEKFRTIKNGKGVAYTVPLTSVIGTLIFGFLSNNRMAVKDNKENTK